MKRLHVHVSVNSLDESIKFYSTMFASDPSVVKSDYAKWMLEDPRVNFAISQRGAKVGLNHLGMQVESTEELASMHQRLEKLEGEIKAEEGAACCYAKSDKYWAEDPQGIPWETFHTLESIPVFGTDSSSAAIGAVADGCGCTPRPEAQKESMRTTIAQTEEVCCGPGETAGSCC